MGSLDSEGGHADRYLRHSGRGFLGRRPGGHRWRRGQHRRPRLAAGRQPGERPISVPATVCGSATAVLGAGLAGCPGGASPGGTSTGTSGSTGSGSGSVTSGNGSAGGGNQVSAPVSVPATVCGNSAAVLGDSLAGCEGTASAGQTARPAGGRDVGGRNGTGGAQSGPGGSIAGSLPPGLGTLPVTSALDALPSPTAPSSVTDLAGPAADHASAAGGGPDGKPLPATTLAADASSGMGSLSFFSLAVGSLLAGAAALRLAGRRIPGRGHHFRGHQA